MVQGKARKALVIEDEDSWVDLLRMVLAEAGYKVLHAQDSRRALAIAETERIDLAIIDLSLPDGFGLDLIEKIHRLPGLENLPVIILSAYHREEVGDLDLGKSFFVSKDQGLPPLLSTVRAVAPS